MWDDTGGGDKQTPEITATAAFEGDETQDDEFNGIVPGNGGKGREDLGAHWSLGRVGVKQRVRGTGGFR